jgi:exopolyphosphatase/pppGpp-phosphohydrolase
MRCAVVDLGSNTIRMSVYDENNHNFRHILSEKEGAKLLISVAPDRIHTIIPGLIGFSQIIKLSRCKTLTVSRSGVREGFIKELFRKNS